jgi:hypothetical protein
MKPERTAPQGVRKEQRMQPEREDSYHATAKMPDPAACPRCRATYLKGRWTWQAAPQRATRHTCPACQRIEDKFPGGYVSLGGKFFEAHRTEIVNLVVALATRAREEHPMQRLMGMEDVARGVLVTTTDPHLARGIAVAVQNAFKGELDLYFSRDENLVRATWTR